MTLNEYMNKNFAVINATTQVMSLEEAIEEVKRDHKKYGDWTGNCVYSIDSVRQTEAIATILNAVVKGELK